MTMAKSIFTTLEEGTFEVNHIGNEVILNLPEWMEELGEIFTDEEKMLEWAKSNEILLPMLQTAIQAVLISLRAVARPTSKTYKNLAAYKAAYNELSDVANYHCDDKKLTISKNIVIDSQGAQARVDEFVWKELKKPGQTKVISEDAALEALAKSGKSDEELMEMLLAKIAAKKAANGQ
jgi:hypothetical protein